MKYNLIWGALFDMISPQVAKQVGGRLGEVEEVEWKKRKDDVNFFMQVRVALPISRPIRRGGFITGTDGERYWLDFKYERLPIFCHYCGILGHDMKHCVAHYAVEKNGGSVEYQYGDFLRATGGRARVLTSQFISNKSSLAEGVGSGSRADSMNLGALGEIFKWGLLLYLIINSYIFFN